MYIQVYNPGIDQTTLRPAVDIEIGHRTATLCHLGNLSYILGRKLVWDGEKQEVVGDEQANRMNARLVLLLANHIGDRAILTEAIQLARGEPDQR